MKKFYLSTFTLALLILFVPNAFAGVCSYSAGGNVTMNNSCATTGGDGQDCVDIFGAGIAAWYYKNDCTRESDIQTEAQACYALAKQFDGITGCKTTCINAAHCVNEVSNVCQVAAANTCAAQNRIPRCDGTCLGPVNGYLECSSNTGNSCVESPAGSGTYVCQMDYGDAAGRQAAGAATSCTAQGKTLADACLGTCTTCSAPYIAGPNGNCVLPLPVAFDTIQQIFVVLYGGSWQALTNLITGGGGTDLVWVGFSGTVRDGDDANGYAGADAFCASGTADVDARVCTVEEILKLNRGGNLPNTNKKAWINGGPPGYNAAANDCVGWKSAAAAGTNTWGRYWNFSTSAGWAEGCNVAYEYACCK